MAVTVQVDVSTQSIQDFFDDVQHGGYVLHIEPADRKDQKHFVFSNDKNRLDIIGQINSGVNSGDYFVHVETPESDGYDVVLHACIDLITIRKLRKNGVWYYANNKLEQLGNVANMIGMLYFLGKLE